MIRVLLVFSVLAGWCLTEGGVIKRNTRSAANFVSTRLKTNGEQEYRVSHSGVLAIETTVPGNPNSLSYRQLTDSTHFVQAIYRSDGTLQDCDITRERRDIDKFIKRFTDGVQNLDGNTVSSSNGHHKNHGHKLHGNRTAEHHYKVVADFNGIKKSCRALHHKVRSEQKELLKEGVVDGRSKRSLLIYPGTIWCGNGDKAKHYHHLGMNENTDKCCRAHDHCPYKVEGFEKKYDFFNYRFYTISHCGCDERFRTCLKSASSGTANMVGSIYFNVVQNKCFLFEAEKKCVRRSWWGKCIKYQRQHIAVLQEPGEF